MNQDPEKGNTSPGTRADEPVCMPSHFIIAGIWFALEERTLDLAGTPLKTAFLPYSPALLDRICGLLGLKERVWPYWLEDWPATWALASILAEEDPLALSTAGPVLDLGCGSGVMGAWFRTRFGIEPYSCDFNSDACRLAALNVAANGDGLARGRVFCADMRDFPLRSRFGLVLAGEMLYARENQEPILDFLRAHLAPGGRALLADKGRSAAEGFAGRARAAGFSLKEREAVSDGRRAVVYELRNPR